MAYMTNTVSRAIQILNTREKDGVDENGDPKREIIIIERNEEGDPVLKDVLTNDGLKDLPLLIFSIVGQTRGGKSLLLNIMIKYLDSQGEGDWLTGTVPDCFSWKEGTTSVTRGLWLYPKVYRRMNYDNEEVGILLLDNQGMFDGEMTSGEMIATAGISTAISYQQMYNQKEVITDKDLQNILNILVQGIEEMNPELSSQMREDYNLTIIVRDTMSTKLGLEGGNEFIEKNNDKKTEEHKTLWKEILKNFKTVQCALLPHPGLVVTKAEFTNNKKVSMLEESFVDEVKAFVKGLFSPQKLTLPVTRLTGEAVYNLLKAADMKEANSNLSFLNNHSDHKNSCKVNNFKRDFDQILSHDLSKIHKKMTEILDIAEKELKGRSKPRHLSDLKKYLEESTNNRVIEIVSKLYSESFENCMKVNYIHKEVWESTKLKAKSNVCGSEETKREGLQRIAQETAKFYYRKRSEEEKQCFEKVCVGKSLKKLQGLDVKAIEKFKECEDFENLADNSGVITPIWLHFQLILKDEVNTISLERIAEAAEISVDWLRGARQKQYEQYEALNLLHKDQHWDEIPEKGKDNLLIKKIGYAMFGSPPLITNTAQSGYPEDQEAKIKPVAKRFAELSTLNSIKFSCLFIITQSKTESNPYLNVPLFLIRGQDSNLQYMDPNCRVYESWKSFLSSNTLPASVVFCYPLSGLYDKTVGFQVAFSKTPVTEKVLRVTDTAANVTSISAGVAGAGLLGAAALGIATPILAPIAVVGGAVAGTYGVIRGGLKMWDKRKHKETVTGKDWLNMGVNALSAVGGGALATTERVVVLATRVAQGVNFLNSFMWWYSEDDPNLDTLLREIYDHKEKILFYFNTYSSNHAITTIKKALCMNDNATTVQVLEQFVQINSITSTEDLGGEIVEKKYVSENVTDLFTCLLKIVSDDVENMALLQDEINKIYQNYKQDVINESEMGRQLHPTMSKLFQNCLKEQNIIKNLFIDTAFAKDVSDAKVGRNLVEELKSENNSLLVLILRDVAWSFIRMVQKGNRFYNGIQHKPIERTGFEGEYHPLAEIIDKIKALVDQGESAADLSSQENTELNGFIDTILSLIIQHGQPSWKAKEIGGYLSHICEDIKTIFYRQLNKDKQLAEEWTDPRCSDLFGLFNQLGNKGNYGSSLLQKVLKEYQPAHHHDMQTNSFDLILLPAWPLVKGLYCYCSKTQVSSKITLVKRLENVAEKNYEVKGLDPYKNLWMINNDDKELFTTFIVFSTLNNSGHEVGFIWRQAK